MFIHLLRGSLLAAGLLSLVACSTVDNWQRRQIYRPVAELSRTPAQLQIAHRDQSIAVAATRAWPASTIHGWWLDSGKADSPAVLFLHGNSGNMGTNLDTITRLREIGWSVLAIDYRGYGRNSAGGALPEEQTMYADAKAAWAHLKKLAPQSRKRLLYGHSLGGAIAIELATQVDCIDALVIESSFTSMADMARERGYGYLPIGLILSQRFDSISKIGGIRAPKLIMHGKQDHTVPSVMSERLFELAAEPKTLWLVPEARHSNISAIEHAAWRNALQRLLGLAQE